MRVMDMRIYVDIDENTLEKLKKRSEEMGMSSSGMARYALLLYLNSEEVERSNSFTMPALIQIMKSNLDNLIPNKEKTFTIASLFTSEVWTSLQRKQKIELSKALARIVESHPNQYIKLKKKLHNRINQYKKLL